MIPGWAKIPTVAKYADVEKRTVNAWMKAGLPFSQLPGGMRLIRLSDVDAFLIQFSVTKNVRHEQADQIVKDIMRAIK